MRVIQGGKGLVYLRILKAPAAVIYRPCFRFGFGKGYAIRECQHEQAVIISRGRRVREALATTSLLDKRGIRVGVVDMPSVDGELLVSPQKSGKLLIVAEQNNGHLYRRMIRTLALKRKSIDT